MSRNHSGDLQHQAEHSRFRRPPVLSYLVILFAVAFLLLLLAFTFRFFRQKIEPLILPVHIQIRPFAA